MLKLLQAQLKTGQVKQGNSIMIYLAQHAKAQDKQTDPLRPLTDEGIAETKTIAAWLKSRGIAIEHLVHSGKLRAQQTAEIFAEILDIESISESGQMNPNDDVDALIQTMNQPNTLYVGHLPQMEKLVSRLVTGDTESRVMTFTNSAVVCLQQHGHSYSIQWLIAP